MHRGPRSIAIPVVGLCLLAASACNDTSTSGDDSKAVAPQNPAATKQAQSNPQAANPQAPAAGTVNFAMPSFAGMNLQDAQDRVQTYGIFYSVSHDLLGSRHQVIDSNWKVCNQSPAAGTAIRGKAADYEGKFDFGAVKLTESCP